MNPNANKSKLSFNVDDLEAKTGWIGGNFDIAENGVDVISAPHIQARIFQAPKLDIRGKPTGEVETILMHKTVGGGDKAQRDVSASVVRPTVKYGDLNGKDIIEVPDDHYEMLRLRFPKVFAEFEKNEASEKKFKKTA